MTDVVSKIMDFESGQLDSEEVLDLFSDLVRTGMAWQLQGSYGRTAHSLIEAGFLTEDGDRTDKEVDE